MPAECVLKRRRSRPAGKADFAKLRASIAASDPRLRAWLERLLLVASPAVEEPTSKSRRDVAPPMPPARKGTL